MAYCSPSLMQAAARRVQLLAPFLQLDSARTAQIPALTSADARHIFGASPSPSAQACLAVFGLLVRAAPVYAEARCGLVIGGQSGQWLRRQTDGMDGIPENT